MTTPTPEDTMTDTTITLTPYQIATRDHVRADMLQAGSYAEWTEDGWKGCSIGCIAKTMLGKGYAAHADLADALSVPEWFLYLQDSIFEGLPDLPARQAWHKAVADVLAVLPPDYNWQFALPRVNVGLMSEALIHAGNAAAVVQAVRDLHERAAQGDVVSDDEWRAARSAAWRVAWRVAWSVAWSAARSAAESAAESAKSAKSARSAVWSVAKSAARSAKSAARSATESAWNAAWNAAESVWNARSAAYQSMRDRIVLALLDGRPMPDTTAIDARAAA